MTGNNKLLMHIRSTNALSSLPPVLSILDKNDSTKLDAKYTYDIPVVILDFSHLESDQGIIVFTDFSEIGTHTCMKSGKVPYEIFKKDYFIGNTLISKNKLFNSSIRRDQYVTLTKMVIERCMSEDQEDDGFIIARFNFDLKIKNNKYLEGYFNHIEIATKDNLSDIFEQGLQYEFLEMLRRMKMVCQPDVYNQLRAKFDFSSFEISRKNKYQSEIELESQLPDQKRHHLSDRVATNLMSKTIVKDSQRVNFDTQMNQNQERGSVKGPIIEEQASNQPLNLDSQLPPMTNGVSPDSMDFSATSTTNIHDLGANMLFNYPGIRKSTTANQNKKKEEKSKGISQMVIPCTPTQSSNETILEVPSFASINTAVASQDLGYQPEMIEPKLEPNSALNLTNISVQPDWSNVTKKYLNRNEHTRIRIKNIHETLDQSESFPENAPYTLKKIRVKGMFPFNPVFIKPYGRTWKIAPFKIIAEDIEDKNLTLTIEINNDDEICKFFNIYEIEDVITEMERINSRMQLLLNCKNEVSFNIKRKTRTLPNNYKYSYWTIGSSIGQII